MKIGDEKMRVKYKDESDGRCFANRPEGCTVMGRDAMMRGCNTYRCPFYKPKGCKDWLRVEKGVTISLIPPEEYLMG